MKKFLFIRWIEAYKFIAKSQMMFYALIGRLDKSEAISTEAEQWKKERVRYRVLRKFDRKDRKELAKRLEESRN